jgi:glycosyltransferase involved in cell wall biosynthesis
MAIKVSVIIPVYNVEKYLKECLDSIINQTLKDIEIICINDGSTDKSLQILEEYAAKEERIKIVNKKNGGQSSARNAGIDIAKGEYIAFLDSDDFIANDFYEKLYNSAEQNNADCAVGNTIYYKDENNKQDDCWVNYYIFKSNKTIVESIEDKQNIIYSCSVWNKIYKKELIKDLRFPEKLYIEDVPFTFATAILANKFVLVKEANLYYRQHNTSIMATIFNSERIFDIFKIYEICDTFLKKVNIKASEKQEFKKILDNFKIFNLYSYYSNCSEKYKKDFEKKLISIIKYIDIKENPYITDESKIYYKRILENKFVKFIKIILKSIFSTKNEYSNRVKHKVITILGIKIKFKK